MDDIDTWNQYCRPSCTFVGANTLEVYLASLTLSEYEDPLMYWLAQKKAGLVLGPLADMAVDYLGVPGKFNSLNLQQRY